MRRSMSFRRRQFGLDATFGVIRRITGPQVDLLLLPLDDEVADRPDTSRASTKEYGAFCVGSDGAARSVDQTGVRDLRLSRTPRRMTIDRAVSSD